MSIVDSLLHAYGVEYDEDRTRFAGSLLVGVILQEVKFFDVLDQVISVFLILSCLEVAIYEVISILENGRVDLMIEKLLNNELIEVFICFVLFVLVFDKVYPFWCLYLHYLRGKLITHEFGQRLNDQIELFVEGSDVEACDFEGEVVETELRLLEKLYLQLLCLALAVIEDR